MRLRAVMTASAVVGMSVFGTPAATGQSADPLRGKQWGLDQINAEQAWTTSTGKGATIAVVDTGIDLTHPDLKSRLVSGATFTCGDKPAPCGNGDWKGPDRVGQKSDSHGTHVAGIAAATANNGIGGAGTAPNASIMPVKVLENGEGSFDQVGAGVRYAADHGADVINLSLGALPGSQLLTIAGQESATKDAIAYARKKGVVVIASAGNETAPLCDTPSWEAGAMCVAATDRSQTHALYSNMTIKPDMKAVAAPGGAAVQGCDADVWSSVPQGTGSAKCGQTDYDAYAGTSMASPFVSGVAALLAAQGRSADNIEQTLMDTARTPLLNQRGSFSPLYGYGIVDAAAAVEH